MKGMLTRLLAVSRRDLALQAIILLGLALLVGWVFRSTGSGLARVGISTDLSFLGNSAGFPISESLIEYAPSDSYGRALLVGLLNTVKVAVVGIALMTVIGVPLGILRGSSNKALALFSQSYVEVIRNTPLLLQLFIWTGLIRGLPAVRQAFSPLPGIYLSQRGLNLPSLDLAPSLPLGWPALLLASAAILALCVLVGRWKAVGIALALAGLALVAAIYAGFIQIGFPHPQGFRIAGGGTISPEFMALTMGLSVYGSAAVAETVRSGIQAVDKGQWEASRAIGLSLAKTVWLVIMPQTLRVVIPPMTSLYMNLIKNSSLAVAIGYPEIVYAANTTMNQSGQIVQVIVILMATYLTMSIFVALLMSRFNERVQMQTR